MKSQIFTQSELELYLSEWKPKQLAFLFATMSFGVHEEGDLYIACESLVEHGYAFRADRTEHLIKLKLHRYDLTNKGKILADNFTSIAYEL